MAQTKAARRYAKALYALAGEKGSVEAVRAGLVALGRLIPASNDLSAFLVNFVIPPARRVQVLGDLFERGPGKVDPLLFQFILLLNEKKRTGLLCAIAREFEALSDEHSGVLRVTIAAPSPLSDAQVAALCERLKHKLSSREIRATQRIDPALLGGFTVQVGDTVFDYSLETQLQTLKRKLAFA